MITDTWWLNRALIVGIPRRSTEWSTESSCTSVARWMSSMTAPRVSARSSRAPEASWASSSVGRNIFPCICSRCPLTSVMSPKSLSMIRRSSRCTPSRRGLRVACSAARVIPAARDVTGPDPR